MKRNRTIDIIVYLLLFAVIAISLILAFFTKADQTTVFVIGGIVVVILVGILVYKNYKSNAYGAKFSQRYPDAKN